VSWLPHSLYCCHNMSHCVIRVARAHYTLHTRQSISTICGGSTNSDSVHCCRDVAEKAVVRPAAQAVPAPAAEEVAVAPAVPKADYVGLEALVPRVCRSAGRPNCT
jgi:hypothetical protein